MSHYGPSGGPQPGPSQGPWVGRQSDDYDQPSDPWGGQDSWGGTPYGAGLPPAESDPRLTTLAPPQKKKSNTPLIAFIVVLAVLVLGGGGVAVYLLGQGDKKGDKKVAADPTTASPQVTDDPSDQPTPDVTTTSAPDSSTSVRLVQIGDCVTNNGTAEKPNLVVADCAPQTYEVLARFDGATTGEADAKRKCSKVSGYDNWYFFNDALDELDFVLCLKKR